MGSRPINLSHPARFPSRQSDSPAFQQLPRRVAFPFRDHAVSFYDDDCVGTHRECKTYRRVITAQSISKPETRYISPPPGSPLIKSLVIPPSPATAAPHKAYALS